MSLYLDHFKRVSPCLVQVEVPGLQFREPCKTSSQSLVELPLLRKRHTGSAAERDENRQNHDKLFPPVPGGIAWNPPPPAFCSRPEMHGKAAREVDAWR